MALNQWSTTPATNATAGSINWAEGQAPSTVNDSARQLMADVATYMLDPQFYNYGDVPTYISTTQFTIPGNQTANYTVNRRIKAIVTAGTIYGTISASAYTSLTTVTVTWDSTLLDAGLSEVDLSIIKNTGITDGGAAYSAASVGQVQKGAMHSAVAGGTADIITATFSPVPVLTDMMEFHVRASAANATTTPTFNPNALGALTITKTGGVALGAGDIYGAGHELKLAYRASPARYELMNPATPVGIGYGQTWQNVAASRARNTTYTNSTSAPIFIALSVNDTVNTNLVIGGVAVGQSNASNIISVLSGIVPVGVTYSWASTTGVIQLWSELR